MPRAPLCNASQFHSTADAYTFMSYVPNWVLKVKTAPMAKLTSFISKFHPSQIKAAYGTNPPHSSPNNISIILHLYLAWGWIEMIEQIQWSIGSWNKLFLQVEEGLKYRV